MTTREMSYQHVETRTHAHDFENRHDHGSYNNPFDGNNGKKMPSRSPIIHIETCPSPPRPSQTHHESVADNKVTSEDVMRFQQDEILKKIMLKTLEQKIDQCFQHTTYRGWKLPHDYDV